MSELSTERKITTRLVLEYLRDHAVRGHHRYTGMLVVAVEDHTLVSEVRDRLREKDATRAVILIRRGAGLLALHAGVEAPDGVDTMPFDEVPDASQVGMVFDTLVAPRLRWNPAEVTRPAAISGLALTPVLN